MPICHWCGDEHGIDQLCQPSQRAMTRRSFCFLFGAGMGAMALGIAPSLAEPAGFGLGGPIEVDQAMLNEFLELLRPCTLIARVPGWDPVPFTVSVTDSTFLGQRFIR